MKSGQITAKQPVMLLGLALSLEDRSMENCHLKIMVRTVTDNKQNNPRDTQHTAQCVNKCIMASPRRRQEGRVGGKRKFEK